MDYYQTVGNEERYVELCVAHADLYKRQKAIDAKDRATAIDIKVQLREKEAERKRVETMSVTDALTGLGNRYSLEREAVHIIRDAGGERITVGVLDIDCFKQLNDTYGHIQGDRCPKVVADILKEAVMDCGHVYRFGGDEFVMLFPAGMENRIEEIAEADPAEDCGGGESQTSTRLYSRILLSPRGMPALCRRAQRAERV